jgi:Lon protease-like protein
MNKSRLPLFPLQVVLLPHAALPLHIYEERYKLLLRECIAKSGEFGIVLAREQGLAEIGCTATVTTVLKTYDDGKMDVLVEGRRRFRIRTLHTDLAPYAVGDIEYPPTVEEPTDPGLARETIALYNELVGIVYGGRIKQLDPDLAGSGISFVMAQKAGLDLEQRQLLLEMDSEQDRLSMLLGYLTTTLPRLKKMEEIERIIRSDGYVENHPRKEI